MTDTLTDFLPSWLGDFVTETATELQVPPNAVAVLGLGAVASAVNGGADTVPTSTWNEPVVLFTLGLLASGEGKSPVFARLFDPIKDASDEVSGVEPGTVLTQKSRNLVIKRYLAGFVTKQMKLIREDLTTLDDAARAIAAEEERLRTYDVNEVIPIRVLTDTTPAALLEAMEHNTGRVVVASAEAEALLNFRGGPKNAVLSGFDGEELTVTRKTTGEVSIRRPILNMTVAMQPTVLGALGSDMVNRGFMPRFLMAYPETLVGKRHSRPTLVTIEASTAYAEAVSDIVERFAKPGDPVAIRWDRAAVREIGSWREEIEPMLAPNGALASIGAWASKVRGAHFIRLAALLTIMDGGSVVSPEHARRAKGILRILIEDAVRAFGEMGASFANDDLVHLMGIVRGNDDNPGLVGHFAKHDVMRASNRFMKDSERCAAALERAVEEGFLVKDGRGWRAS